MADETASEPKRQNEDRLELSKRMTQLIEGFQISAAIGAVARLGVADSLAGGPAGAADLAERLGADAPLA